MSAHLACLELCRKTLTAGDSAVLLADAWSGGPMAIEAAQSNGTLQVTHQQLQPQSQRP